MAAFLFHATDMVRGGDGNCSFTPSDLRAAATCSQASDTARAGLWPPYSPKLTITHTNSSTVVNRTIHVRPAWHKGYAFAIYYGLFCGHPQDQAPLPLTLLDCNHQPWCGPSVASEHPRALVPEHRQTLSSSQEHSRSSFMRQPHG